MKKIVLTSLLAMVAASGANAANVIDGNPLYMPGQNHFYSVTSLNSHSEHTDDWTLAEEFGYGIMDNLAVNVRAAMEEQESFDYYGVGELGVKLTFRALDQGEWKADVFGEYGIGGPSVFYHDGITDDNFWFDKDLNEYSWKAGVRGGYTTSLFTVAGRVEFAYDNTESFNWDEEGRHTWTLGLDGQYVIDNDFNLVASVEYTGLTDSWAHNAGRWFGEFGVNYNFDATKFAGLYVNGSLNHQDGAAADEWGWDDGFGFGAKFGIDF
ncbi:MAG: hypothetical protein ACLRFI_01505 [Alphaproteobacteria bacterium]